jgi:8-oxo-dGTP diphosphatase
MAATGEGAALDEDGPRRVTLIVDGANVMGSRADGWWRDRAGAMTRLHDQLAALAARGIPGAAPGAGPESGGVSQDAGGVWFPNVLLVVEGKARGVRDQVPEAPGIEVIAARGEGDDEIASLAGRVPGRRIVITADRELRQRCEDAGADVAGPRWLLELLT